MALLGRYGGAFAVADAGIALQGGGFAAQRQFGSLFAVDGPGVEQIQIRRRAAGNVGFVGQGGKKVLRRKAGNVVGGLHGALDGSRGKVRRAGIAPAVAQINGHAERFVSVALHVFESALAHRNGKPRAFGGFGSGIAGAEFFGVGQGAVYQLFKKSTAVGKARQRFLLMVSRGGSGG